MHGPVLRQGLAHQGRLPRLIRERHQPLIRERRQPLTGGNDTCPPFRASAGNGGAGLSVGKRAMTFSKYNLLSRVRGSESWFIANLLSKQADILEPAVAREILDGRDADAGELAAKGYLVDEKAEAAHYRRRYEEFLARRDEGEVQVFFVPWYDCNFGCSYCYQSGYGEKSGSLSEEVTDSFFDYLDRDFGDRAYYVTLFGGEPLLPGRARRVRLEHFFKRAEARRVELALVTNGYHLEDYLALLDVPSVREIQVTLDGVETVHDGRRRLRGGGPTFGRIVRGIDLALEAGHTVNLRVVLDRENMESLPDLARFARDRGWTDRCTFKTQLGRNYALHTCSASAGLLFERAEFWERIYGMILEYPEVGVFHRPAFSFSRFLFDEGDLPDPVFDACPACTTEWAFDYTGYIYPCTATVGKSGESLGTFYPTVALNHTLVTQWKNRDVTGIEACRDCPVQLTCGGGCGSVAKNRTGELLSPDCRPEKELAEMGLSLYVEKGVL
jgi:uncharacterized protein